MSNIVEESKADGTFYVILNLLNLAGLISANLGVMNLLPIPALDGGRLVFLILEVLRGKPVKKEHEGMVLSVIRYSMARAWLIPICLYSLTTMY